MKIQGVSSRPSSGIFAAVALCALLALTLSVSSAAGKPGKCIEGAEAAGCKLPEGARFYKKLPNNASITVQIGGKGVSIDAYAAAIKCTKFAPNSGNEAYVAVGLSGSQHPKVGKTYKLKERETQRGGEGEGTSSAVTEVTLNFKSAKLVVVKMHQVTETDGTVGCDGGETWKVKRQG